jgi:hypothetical protein
MLVCRRFVCVISLAFVLVGCGGKDEFKKNEGTIVNTPPTSASAPGVAPTPGAAGADPGLPPSSPKAKD